MAQKTQLDKTRATAVATPEQPFPRRLVTEEEIETAIALLVWHRNGLHTYSAMELMQAKQTLFFSGRKYEWSQDGDGTNWQLVATVAR